MAQNGGFPMALGQDPGEKWNKSQIKGQNKTAFPLFCRKLFIIMQNAFLFTGFGSALRYEYVEGLFWDSKIIFDQLLEWFQSQASIQLAAFHSFLRTSGSGIFKSPDQDETESSDCSDTPEGVNT